MSTSCDLDRKLILKQTKIYILKHTTYYTHKMKVKANEIIYVSIYVVILNMYFSAQKNGKKISSMDSIRRNNR